MVSKEILKEKGGTVTIFAFDAEHGLSEHTAPYDALVIITDGEDNSSRYTFSEIKDFAKESDAQIYVIGERGDIGYGRGIINDIVRLTGGRAFFPSSFKQLDYYCDLIHTELRNQYTLAYYPSIPEDGRFHKITVKAGDYVVRARNGYYN